ncbi:MAG: acyclic terpene utilization AtuA family protein [Candidatus Abyssubacteria bacterium]|nr:acyclic terpene utilization AtuA family protein [Candidatus Abyssubacteria bacterium]
MAVIHAEIEKDYVRGKLREGKINPLGPVPELTEDEVEASVRIVGQMGVEPFVKAIEAGAQVIVAGRANDPSMFAALPFLKGFDKGLSLHMAKILECAAIAAEPGSGSDAMMGTLRNDHFLVEPLNPQRICTTTSVAAHSLYEKSDPLRLYSPGGLVDLSNVTFEQHSPRVVEVSGSRYIPDNTYRIKLEGSKRTGYRTMCVAGVRDPGTIGRIDELIREARKEVAGKYSEHADSYKLIFHAYGRDGVMGELEPHAGSEARELGIVIEAVAPTQGLATGICATARTIMVHYGFPGRVSTAGNLAFPFSPLDIPAGPVYEFNIYHLVEEDDPHRLFPMDIVEV